MSMADHPSNRRQRPPQRPVPPPWYRAAHHGLETCAFPGACDSEAVVELDVDYVTLGFCEPHALMMEMFSDEAVLETLEAVELADDEDFDYDYEIDDDVDIVELQDYWRQYREAFEAAEFDDDEDM